MPRAVTPTARARRTGEEEEEEEEESPMLLVERGGEVEGDDGDDDDGDDDDEEGEEATPSSIRSRSVTSHHGPIVLTLRSMPRSAASLCTSAKVSKGAGGGGGGGGGGGEKEEGEEEETAGSASLADLLLRWCGRLRGKGGFIRRADSDREACSGSESSPRCGDGGSARCLIALSKVFFFASKQKFFTF
jgi:hypothetical protein